MLIMYVVITHFEVKPEKFDVEKIEITPEIPKHIVY